MATIEKPLYFIAIVPPSPVLEEGQAFKEYFFEKYQSKAALKSPPHITLHMPFRYNEKKEEKMRNILQVFARNRPKFEVHLKDFSAFPPKVIFIDVAQNPELKTLQKELEKTCRLQLKLTHTNYKDQAFHPHMTIAFRDLKKPKFREAWEEFKEKEYRAKFEVDHIVLLKHNGERWAVFENFKFD